MMQRILVLDDDDQFRSMVSIVLAKAGYEAVTADNGQNGLQILRETDIDLVITDLVMPGKEGVETIMEMRRDFPEVIIIAVSGGGRVGPNSYLDLAGQLGASRTFSKPLKTAHLVSAVRELLADEGCD